MKYLRNKLSRVAASVVAALLIASTSFASPIVLDYSGASTPGVALEITGGGIFQTSGATAVNSFLNWGNFIPAIDGVGKIKLTNIALVGSASQIVPGLFFQATSGGLLEVFDLADALLLSVGFTDGALTLASTGVGSQLTTNIATFGGALAANLIPTSATHSISLVGWSSVGLVPVIEGQGFNLTAGSGFGNGLVGGTEVPEPTTLLLFGSGVLGAIRARRRAV